MDRDTHLLVEAYESMGKFFNHPEYGKIEILAVDDHFIYFADRGGKVWQFNTELWPERLKIPGATKDLLPFMGNHVADRVAEWGMGPHVHARNSAEQMDRADFQ